MTRTFVIAGGGLAGAKAAEAGREEGFDGRVVLLAEEDERPSERPPLSKEYLRGESEREALHVHPAAFYDEHAIELRTGTRAEALDLRGQEVELAGGERLGFDRLLLATGAEPRSIPVPGAEKEGVHLLRTVGDSERLRTALRDGARVGAIGAGWSGRRA